MERGKCSKCSATLTSSNCGSRGIERGRGPCRSCARNNIDRKQRRRIHYNWSRTVKGRHKTIKRFLKKENISKTDLLWNLNFYSALIQDACCHYCSGALAETSHALDRINNDIGHTCYNVVPCCRRCNYIKGYDTSYEEMFLLVPALKEIIKLRILAQHDPSADQSGTIQTCVALN